MDSKLIARLKGQMARGEVILFTGAGFSLAARNRFGGPIPCPAELRDILWPIAFPNTPLDPSSSLADVYECAIRVAGGKTCDALRHYLVVDTTGVPEIYKLWFSMPWARIYTLNLDDLDEAAQSAFGLERELKAISALTGALPLASGDLLSIHLNGRVTDCPQVTFSQQQYGARTARPDPWYQHLVTDLASHPIVFVGTQLDEPPLWQQIELRRSRERRVRELRPGSYLVTPGLSVARRSVLEQFNIDLIEMKQEEFAEKILANMESSKQRGFASIRSRFPSPASQPIVRRVSDSRNEPDTGNSEFLLGREPTWADITSGRAVKRGFEDGLRDKIVGEKPQVILVIGTAGAGRSTTIMRLALRFDAEGKQVAWLNSQTEHHIHAIRTAIADDRPDVVVIDDVDNFGGDTGRLLLELAEGPSQPMVLVSMRTTRYDRLEIDEWLKNTKSLTFAVPHLEDADIELLIDALTTAGRLGALRDKTRREQITTFRESAGRQLLVAMIEATSNERFEEKIDRECSELTADAALVYGTIALATSHRTYLTREEILLAVGEASNEAMNLIERLIQQRLLILQRGNEIRVRHRVIAERVVDYFKENGQLSEPLIGLVWAMAIKAHPELPKYSREHKLLRTLMNHDYMIRLTDDRETPRKAYELIEDMQRSNYHYYLQRGSYEVEIGDLDLAKNLLEQARSLSPDDYMVQTEWAYMTLKRAAQNATSVHAIDQAREAIAELEDAISRRGKDDPYPYHVLGSQGLGWIRRAIISKDEKARELARLLQIVRGGAKRHPKHFDLRQLAEDLEREYLMLAVPTSAL